MKLTEEQKLAIKELYGDDLIGYNKLLDVIRKRINSIPKIFDKDGYINYTIEEVEKMFNNPNKIEWEDKKNDILLTDKKRISRIISVFGSLKSSINELKHIESLDVIKDEIEQTTNCVRRRYNLLKIDKEIHQIEQKIKELEQLKESISQD